MSVQPSWKRATTEGVRAAQGMTSALVNDLDESAGGIGWWRDHLPADLRAHLADYLVSVGYAVSDSLERLAYSCEEYRKTANSQDHHFRNQLLKARRAGAGRLPDMRTKTDDDLARDAKENVLTVAFYVSAASLMDNLATLTIGTLGLCANILTGDAGFLDLREAKTEGGVYPPAKGRLAKSLESPDTDAGRFQREALRAVRVSVHQAGPPDWWPWTDDMRNVQAHQGTRSGMKLMPKGQRGGLDYLATLAPRQPRMTDAQNLQVDALAEAWIMEDSRDLLGGLLSSLNAATVGILVALHKAWEIRRRNPDLVRQPVKQWPEPPGRLNFPGYGNTVEVRRGTNAYISPEAARRFLASRARG